MNIENKAFVKAALLEILAECDSTTSDILIKRLHPIVKNCVNAEFKEHRNKLMMEVAVTLGQIMHGNQKPLWESTPQELGLSEKDLQQNFGKKK